MPHAGAGSENHHETHKRNGDGCAQVRLENDRNHHQSDDATQIDDGHPQVADSSTVVMSQRGEHHHHGNLCELARLYCEFGHAKPPSCRKETGGVFNEEDGHKGDQDAQEGHRCNPCIASVVHRAKRQRQRHADACQNHLLDRDALKDRISAQDDGYAGAGYQHYPAKRQDEGQQQ